MNVSTIKATSCVVTLAGCIQFVILTIIAMFTFPGGKHPDIDSTGYNFFENFFSDLGGTVTPNFMPNPVSSVLFFIALFAIGTLTVPFLVVIPSLYRAKKTSYVLAWIGSIIGLIAAVAFIGVAFTPWNLYMGGHIFFVQVAFIGLIPLALFYLLAAATAKQQVLPRRYTAILVEFLLAAILYVVLLFTGPALDTPAGLVINAVGQKLIVYNSIFVIAFLAYGSLGLVRKV
jgi:hypothetical protein